MKSKLIFSPFLIILVLALSGSRSTGSSPWGAFHPGRYVCGETGSCSVCTNPGDGHKAPPGQGLAGEGHDYCAGQANCLNHGACEGPMGEVPNASKAILAELIAKVKAGDVSAPALLTERFPGLFTINEDRQSLQVAGCGQVIVANIPLASTQLAYLNGN